MADRPGRGSDVLADPMVLAIDGPGEDDDAGGDAAPSLLPGAPQAPGGAGAEGGAEGGAAAAAEGGRPRGMQRSLSMAKHHLQQASQVIETTLLEALDERGKLHPVPLDVAASKLEVGGLELSVEVEGAWERAQLAAHPTPKHRKSPEKGKAAKAKYETRRSSSAMDDGPCVRRAAAALIATQVLEFVVIISIIVNTVILAAQHPNNDYSASANTVMESIDLALTCVFTVEMAIRIAAHGFNTAAQPGQPAYFHEGWNRLDFFVVIISWVSVIYDLAQPSGADGNLSGLLQSLSALRLLRFLRVIKSVPFFADVGAILATLGDSVAQSANILGFLFFVFLVAGIVGIQMFSGMLAYRCSVTPPAPDLTGWDRPAGGDGGMGLGIQHRHCFPTPPADPDSRTPENLCSATECPGVLVYPDHDADREPVLANNTSAGCPKCFQDHGSCQGEEMCWKFGNPGFGYHGFDNIVMSWLTIFIEMANLYWWETGYRTLDTSVGLSAEIAYEFGFIIVFVLSMVSVNMFVAVITDTFGTVRAAEDLIDLIDKKVQVKLTVVAKNANPPKHTSVPGKPYTVYVGLSGDSTVGDVKKTFQRHFLERDVIDRHLCAYENDSKNADDLDLKIGDFLDDTKVIADLEDDQLLAVTMLEQKEEVGPTVDPQLVRDSEVQSTAPGKGIEVFDPDQKTRCKRPNGTVVYQIWEDTVALSDNDKYQGGVDDDGNKKMVTVKRLLELHHKPPRYRVKCCSNLVTKTSFDSFIMAFILLNTLTLASEHFMMDESLVTFLGNVGHIFNLVFTFEMVSKMLGMGVKNYLTIPFNRLDCFIVLTSLLNYLGDVLPGASVARLLRVFRLFRVARVIRILYKYESMKRLLNTVMGSGVALANLTLFILFTVTIFRIFGMHLFGGAYPTEGCVEAVIADGKPESFSVAVDKAACEAVDVSGDSIIEEQAVCEAVMTAAVDDGAQRACKYVTELALPRRSFEHFGVAWMMAFQTLTGDDWCNQMYQTMNVAGAFLPAMVFGLCFVCCNYILTNLFIAVILENFEIAEKTKKRKQQKMDALEKKEKVLEEIVNRADTEWQDEMKELNDAEVLTDGKFGKLQFDVGTKTMLIVADDGAPSQAVDYDGVGRLISEAAEERMRQKAAAAGGGGSRRDGRRMEVRTRGISIPSARTALHSNSALLRALAGTHSWAFHPPRATRSK